MAFLLRFLDDAALLPDAVADKVWILASTSQSSAGTLYINYGVRACSPEGSQRVMSTCPIEFLCKRHLLCIQKVVQCLSEVIACPELFSVGERGLQVIEWKFDFT